MIDYDFVSYAMDALAQNEECAFEDLFEKLDEIEKKYGKSEAYMLVNLLSFKFEEELAADHENMDKYFHVPRFCYLWYKIKGYDDKWQNPKFYW